MPDFRSAPWHDLLNNDIMKIDQLIFGALSSVDTPTWTNDTHYGVGNTAFDGSDGSTWICTVDHTSAVSGTFADDRTAHPTYWTSLLVGFAPRGEWQNSTQYFPYDLAYQSDTGTFALCKTKHVSNVSGDLMDDEVFWSILMDFSSADVGTAVAVTYNHATSGLVATNVQAAIDELETQIVAINNVNINQGSDIGVIQTVNNTQNTTLAGYGSRLTSIESVNTAQDSTLSSQNTRITALETALGAGTVFPSGTKMLFYQAASPTGWTKVTTDDDKILRVVSGTTGGTSGGTNSFSTVNIAWSTSSYALNLSQIPAHTHDYSRGVMPGGGPIGTASPGIGYTYDTQQTGPAGSGAGHSHNLVLAIKYIDIIVASRN